MDREKAIKYLKAKYYNDYALLISRFGDVEKYIIEPTREKIKKQYENFCETNNDKNFKLEIVSLF